MEVVSGQQNGLLGFDFWNGWWRLKRKKNG